MKVHWTDERGEWIRRTFTSRPDNLVVQWLTAPKGQSVNVRITLSAVARRARRKRSVAVLAEQSNVQQDFNEQRLIYKGRLDPSVEQQRLRRRDPRRSRRRHGADGGKHAGHRECVVRNAAHAH